MGFFDFLKPLFGGSTSSTSSTATSTPGDYTPPEYAGLRGPLADFLSKSLAGGGVTPQYGGPLVAGLGAGEQDVLNQLNTMTAPGNARSSYLDDVISGKYISGQNPYLNAYITAAQQPTLQGLQQTLDTSLPGKFTLGGQIVTRGPFGGSSAFDRAAALATTGTAQALGKIATDISFGAYEGERGRQQQAVQLSQAEVDTTLKNLQAQALPRLIEDLGIERGLALFDSRSKELLQILTLLGGLTSPNLANKAASSASGSTDTHSGIVPGLFPKGI